MRNYSAVLEFSYSYSSFCTFRSSLVPRVLYLALELLAWLLLWAARLLGQLGSLVWTSTLQSLRQPRSLEPLSLLTPRTTASPSRRFWWRWLMGVLTIPLSALEMCKSWWDLLCDWIMLWGHDVEMAVSNIKTLLCRAAQRRLERQTCRLQCGRFFFFYSLRGRKHTCDLQYMFHKTSVRRGKLT